MAALMAGTLAAGMMGMNVSAAGVHSGNPITTIPVTKKTFEKITKINYIKPIVIPFGLVILGISLLPTDHTVTKFFESIIYRFMVLGVTFILVFCILLFANYKKKKQVVKRNE